MSRTPFFIGSVPPQKIPYRPILKQPIPFLKIHKEGCGIYEMENQIQACMLMQKLDLNYNIDAGAAPGVKFPPNAPPPPAIR